MVRSSTRGPLLGRSSMRALRKRWCSSVSVLVGRRYRRNGHCDGVGRGDWQERCRRGVDELAHHQDQGLREDRSPAHHELTSLRPKD
ncbi:unnamed protein product [Sphacelaria rigidula]